MADENQSNQPTDRFRMIRILSMFIIFFSYYWNKPTAPPREVPHRHVTIDNFLSAEQHQQLMRFMETQLTPLPTAIPKHQTPTSTKWTSMGEEYEPLADGQCLKPYTALNEHTRQCTLSDDAVRIKHFIQTGGYNGWKETAPKLQSRLNSFTLQSSSSSSSLFESDEFESAVEKICGRNNPYFKPFPELSFSIQIPGQSVPMHLDVPFFWPATKYQFPAWLLMVMQFSGLFQQQRIPQVQAVVYLHDWPLTNASNDAEYAVFDGHFVAYDKGHEYKPVVIPARPRSAIVCDGSEVVHGSSTFLPDAPSPNALDMDMENGASSYSIRFDAQTQRWTVFTDNDNDADAATNLSFSWREIRASMVYRGWCFADKEIMKSHSFHEWSEDLTLDDILAVLKKHLIHEMNAISEEKWNALDAYQKANFLMDTFVKLPKSESRIPVNYCSWLEKVPMLQNLIC
eukprot:CAMPEP_0202714020 /NCGR_PEP_ID=MMETSP1385-20130828/62279_1 /ASSEMBLY_ACC=CAM_ASM_000861 /TAXON_ID=933848 /ORGANISM="Elphidium margaritaceum" /LENGTH=455 /DNA_ID=CAMNT_0049374581 /DNA_START=20 /DNA_END=1387 /DNA_ORIENTATION=+